MKSVKNDVTCDVGFNKTHVFDKIYGFRLN